MSIKPIDNCHPDIIKDFHPYSAPDILGKYGIYGGRFIAETLIQALDELLCSYQHLKDEPEFIAELEGDLATYVGRPTPLYLATRLSEFLKGPKIYLKREDLCHTGAHKINNTVAQALLAKKMGKTRIIAETGAGQHGVATATVAARMGMDCHIYMGADDIARQALNVHKMQLLGANVIKVESGSRTLKDAMSEALRDWVANVEQTHYIIGSVAGPHPYPMMVRNFQSVIGREARQQILVAEGRLPDAMVACVGGGSNAMGLFYPFISELGVRLICVEGGGEGLTTGRHSAPLNAGKPGVLHGNKTYLLMDKNGQICSTHSIAPGLDYPGVGPELSYLKDTGRIECTSANDKEALAAGRQLCLLEGIIPALESSHALAFLARLATEYDHQGIIILNLSGRGDKDMQSL